MNLFQISEKIDDTKADISYYKKEIERLKIYTDVGAINPAKIMQKSGTYTREDAILELTQMDMYLDEALNKLNNLTKLRDIKYDNYKKHNDYDRQIYVEKKLFKWSNAKISARHSGISKSQIYRIVDKIEQREKKGN